MMIEQQKEYQDVLVTLQLGFIQAKLQQRCIPFYLKQCWKVIRPRVSDPVVKRIFDNAMYSAYPLGYVHYLVNRG